MNLFNVVDTEQEAIDGTVYDNEAFIASIPHQDVDYLNITQRWAYYSQRLDGKYVWPVCPASDAVYPTEEYNTSWFADSQME